MIGYRANPLDNSSRLSAIAPRPTISSHSAALAGGAGVERPDRSRARRRLHVPAPKTPRRARRAGTPIRLPAPRGPAWRRAEASTQRHDRRDPSNQRRAREQPQPAELPVGRLAAQLQPHRFLGATPLFVELGAFELEAGMVAIERLLQRRDDDVGQRRFELLPKAWAGGGSGFAMLVLAGGSPLKLFAASRNIMIASNALITALRFTRSFVEADLRGRLITQCSKRVLPPSSATRRGTGVAPASAVWPDCSAGTSSCAGSATSRSCR